MASTGGEWREDELGDDVINDAVSVLVSLGLNKTDVLRTIKRVADKSDSTEDIVAKVLKGL